MSAKDCGGHHDEGRRKLYRCLFATFLALIILTLFTILLIWLILRPTKPHFILQDATVYAFNFSSPNLLLTSNLQVTLSARNPNGHVGIYYDKLDVYVTYRTQQITLPAMLPCTYQGHKDVTVWSPFVYGNAISVAPYLADALGLDQMAGTVLINIRVNGRVRWKVGTFISGRYHLYVNCPTYMMFGNRNNGLAIGPTVKYQLLQNCNVDV